LAGALPEVWSDFSKAGFQMSELFFEHLDQLRIADPDLRSPRDYFVEVARETFQLCHAVWRPQTRKAIGETGYRSPYLGLLEQKIAAGAWPELGGARIHARMILDPAFLRYVGLKVESREALAIWMGMLDEYQAEKDREAAELLEEIQPPPSVQRRAAERPIKSFLDAVFLRRGFEPAPLKRKDYGLRYSRILQPDGLMLVVQFEDLPAIRNPNPGMLIAFTLPALGNARPPSREVDPIIVDINRLLPGGNEYLRHRHNPRWFALGCIATATFLDLLAKKYCEIAA